MTGSFRYSVSIDGTDINGMTLANARITYGSTASGQDPSPTVAYLNLITVDAAGDLAQEYPGVSWNGGIPSGYVDAFADRYEGALSALKVGASIVIRVGTDSAYIDRFEANYRAGFDSTRFTGIITALDYTPSIVGITAVDVAERLNRVELDPAAWPAELELDRVARIMAEAGIDSYTVHGSSSYTMREGQHSSKRTAWKHLVATALSGHSIVWVDREGELTYRTEASLPETTYIAPSNATLVDPLQMSSELGDVINSLELTYGADATLTSTDAASVTAYGLRERKLTSELADAVEAQTYADEWIALRAEPYWHMNAATVHLGLANDDGITAQLLNVDLDDVLELPVLLPASPTVGYSSRVLGYTEQLDPYEWLITYVLDPYGWRAP